MKKDVNQSNVANGANQLNLVKHVDGIPSGDLSRPWGDVVKDVNFSHQQKSFPFAQTLCNGEIYITS